MNSPDSRLVSHLICAVIAGLTPAMAPAVALGQTAEGNLDAPNTGAAIAAGVVFAPEGEYVSVGPFEVSARLAPEAELQDGANFERAPLARVRRLLSSPNAPASSGRIYVFAASDDTAVTWAGPSSDNALALEQNRVEFGDHAVGVTYERRGASVSVTVVDREVSRTIGNQSHSEREPFAGVAFTLRN